MLKECVGDATLYLGDCREVIPTLEGVRAVVSDPPYGIEDIVGAYGREAKTIANDRNLDCCFEAIQACQRFRDIRLALFYSCRITEDFFARVRALEYRNLNYVGEIIWDKKAPGMGGGIRYQHENIAVFEIGNPPPIGEVFSVIADMRTPSLHPHQKPLTLMQTLCNVANGDVVFDPFMGSGSTGVAALKTGRKFIGIEIDEGHFETALRRITEAQKQEALW